MSCPDCFAGHAHDGEPGGRLTYIHGLETYVAEPAEGRAVKGIIVIIPDAFGIEFINNKLLADHYAAKGNYRVYLPDFMAGHSAAAWMLESMRKFFQAKNIFAKIYHIGKALFGYIPFIYYNRIPKSWPRVQGFFEQLRKDEGASLPIGAAGFCWGGKHVITLADGKANQIDGKPLIDAGFTAHPSMLDLPADIERMTLPVSFAIGTKDARVGREAGEKIKEIVEAKPEAGKGEVVIFEDASHGFAIRADLQFSDTAKQAGEAENQCIAWFNTHFKI